MLRHMKWLSRHILPVESKSKHLGLRQKLCLVWEHIHLLPQTHSSCLVDIDLTHQSATGLLYLHGWEGPLLTDRWRPADGTPGNATFIIVILLTAHPQILSTPCLRILHLFFHCSELKVTLSLKRCSQIEQNSLVALQTTFREKKNKNIYIYLSEYTVIPLLNLGSCITFSDGWRCSEKAYHEMPQRCIFICLFF